MGTSSACGHVGGGVRGGGFGGVGAVAAEPALVSYAELVGDVDDDDAGGEQQACFEPQRALIVQQLLPPAGEDVFGDEDQHHGVWLVAAQCFDVGDQGPDQVAVWGLEDGERDRNFALVPGVEQVAGVVGINVEGQRVELVGSGRPSQREG